LASTGEKIILLREETKPEDIHGFLPLRESSPVAVEKPLMPLLSPVAYVFVIISSSITFLAQHRGFRLRVWQPHTRNYWKMTLFCN